LGRHVGQINISWAILKNFKVPLSQGMRRAYCQFAVRLARMAEDETGLSGKVR
jgi:hypothetical protein